MGHCEQCGRLTEALHHRGPKRFCSTSCARRYSVSCSRKMVAFHARTRGGRHSSANQLASDRKSSYSVPMVSSHCFCPQNHSPPIPPRISIGLIHFLIISYLSDIQTNLNICTSGYFQDSKIVSIVVLFLFVLRFFLNFFLANLPYHICHCKFLHKLISL